jgi:gas vesicle protein
VAGKNNFWLGMILGAAAGAASALFYAPKKGTELREDVKHTARETGRKAGAAWGDVKERTSDMASTAGEKVREGADKSMEMLANLRTRITEAVQVGKHAAEEKREALESDLEQEKAKASAEA